MPSATLVLLGAAGLMGGLTGLTAIASAPGSTPTAAAPSAAAYRGPVHAMAAPPAAAYGGPVHAIAGTAPGAPAAARPSRSGATRTAATWRWPLRGTPRVVRGFEPPPQRWLPGHRGVDLAAIPGDAVVAAGAGTVTFAGPLAGRGVVTVTHGELRTTYEPVTATVHVGERVDAGEQIGTLASGASHCGGYPSCLHWGLLRGQTYLDPLALLGLTHPILLPIPR